MTRNLLRGTLSNQPTNTFTVTYLTHALQLHSLYDTQVTQLAHNVSELKSTAMPRTSTQKI